MQLLVDKAEVTEAHQSALAQVMYTLIRSQLPSTVKDSQVFEGSIVSFAWLYQFAKVRKCEDLAWEEQTVTCQLSYQRLADPVTFESFPKEYLLRRNVLHPTPSIYPCL